MNFNPLFGAEFSIKNWKRIDAPENSFLWEVAKELTEFADRNFKKWKGKKT